MMTFFYRSLRSFAIVLTLCLSGCGGSSESQGEGSAAGGEDLLRVVATTTMVADMARVVAGDKAEIIGLMAPGVDPHSYTLPARAVADLKSADVIFFSGLKLEGRSEELYKPLAGEERQVVAVTRGLPKDRLLASDQYEDFPDPHVWGDVELWAACVQEVVKTLQTAQPDAAADFAARGDAYVAELMALHEWVASRIATIPESNRTLVTSHDAFNYFGRAYGLDVIGVQGISTVDKAGLADIAKTADLVKEQKIPAIFVETSVARDAIERIANDSGAVIGGLLFSDSLGAVGQVETVNGETYDTGTYAGMIKHNVNTVVEALGAK